MTRVADVMTRGVRTVAPSDTVAMAARLMEEMDVGSLPVCDDDEGLVGIVTDRDIVVRAVAHGRAADATRLEDVMTPDPQACFEDQPVEEVSQSMRDAQVRRMPVIDRDHHVIGVVSLGDLAVKHDEGNAEGEPSAPASRPPTSTMQQLMEHPAGTMVGAAAGVAAGLVSGIAAGPVGSLAGAVVGGAMGAVAGSQPAASSAGTPETQSVAGEEDPDASMGTPETRRSLQQEQEASKPRGP